MVTNLFLSSHKLQNKIAPDLHTHTHKQECTLCISQADGVKNKIRDNSYTTFSLPSRTTCFLEIQTAITCLSLDVKLRSLSLKLASQLYCIHVNPNVAIDMI